MSRLQRNFPSEGYCCLQRTIIMCVGVWEEWLNYDKQNTLCKKSNKLKRITWTEETQWLQGWGRKLRKTEAQESNFSFCSPPPYLRTYGEMTSILRASSVHYGECRRTNERRPGAGEATDTESFCVSNKIHRCRYCWAERPHIVCRQALSVDRWRWPGEGGKERGAIKTGWEIHIALSLSIESFGFALPLLLSQHVVTVSPFVALGERRAS